MKSWTEIVEIMDTDVPVKVTWSDQEGFETDFKVAGKEYHFSAMADDSEEVEYEIGFSRIGKNKTGKLEANFDVIGDMGMKETLAVFSAVKTSLMKWLKLYTSHKDYGKPGFSLPIFYFSAKVSEASRMKLYDKFAKMIAKKLKISWDKDTRGKNTYYTFY